MRSYYSFILVFCVFSLLSSCKFNTAHVNGHAPIARVHGSYLYESDLSGITPPGVNEKDSTMLIRNYIDNWARQQLLMEKAKLNLALSEFQSEIDKQIEAYRVSLIIHAYKQELIRQQLDTTILESEIVEYYNNHKDKLLLRDHAIMINYIKVSNGLKGLKKVKRLFISNDRDDREELKDFCRKHAFEFLLDEKAWIELDNLNKLIPIDVKDAEGFLRSNKHFEKSDSLYRYIVHLQEYRVAGDVAPLVMERENIRSIILNQRKRNLVINLERSVLRDALNSGEFEIYGQQ